MGRYKLTRCPKCGEDIFAEGGCCFKKQKIIYKCECGEAALKSLEEKNRKTQESRNVSNAKRN